MLELTVQSRHREGNPYRSAEREKLHGGKAEYHVISGTTPSRERVSIAVA